MDRREHLKLLLAGGAGAGLLFASGCSTEDQQISRDIIAQHGFNYGRTAAETRRDASLMAETFFTESEFEVVQILSDIIIPADEESGGALEAEVPDFIEFMMKDMPEMQLVTRGGIMWLNSQCNSMFGRSFTECSDEQQLEIIEKIAWPDNAAPDMQYGVRFFNRMRDLTVTGFFTSQIGVSYLDYRGNRPGFWNGVPQEVLDRHNLQYDEKTLNESIKEDDRNNIADWA